MREIILDGKSKQIKQICPTCKKTQVIIGLLDDDEMCDCNTKTKRGNTMRKVAHIDGLNGKEEAEAVRVVNQEIEDKKTMKRVVKKIIADLCNGDLNSPLRGKITLDEVNRYVEHYLA